MPFFFSSTVCWPVGDRVAFEHELVVEREQVLRRDLDRLLQLAVVVDLDGHLRPVLAAGRG